MKFRFVICLIIGFAFSCGNQQEQFSQPVDSTLLQLARVFPNDTLEKLFLFKNEKQLKIIFGGKNVTSDTLYDDEGKMYFGSRLYNKTRDEVVIQWKDTSANSGVARIWQYCSIDEKEEKYITNTRWRSELGFKLGTKLTELVELNGNDFMFYGLGWEYGGEVTDWKSGNFENKNIYVRLGVDELDENTEKCYLKLMGDKEYSSRNPAALQLNPFVIELMLSSK